jgi:hypothetical protein
MREIHTLFRENGKKHEIAHVLVATFALCYPLKTNPKVAGKLRKDVVRYACKAALSIVPTQLEV